ncbi:hypothetical protein [Streptomyces melanogenes]|uniref:hypothetical protein n=1 Tax=Streptomyces melanogenes TaxID=67326 RepID=UPI00379674A2
MSDQEETDPSVVVIDVSHILVMPSEEFQQYVERVSPALRAVLERRRARHLGGPDCGSFMSFIEPSL